MSAPNKLLIITALLILSLLACSFPLQVAVMMESPTPDYTVTAIIQQVTQQSKDREATANAPIPVPTETMMPPPPPSTATPLPLPTATTVVYPQRPGGVFTAAPFTPTIDGNFTEWTAPEYPVTSLNAQIGSKYWSGANDLSGKFRSAWDMQNLYIAVTVVDDIYAQRATQGNIYLGDSVEIQLDADLYGDFYVNYLTNDDYQLGISPGYVNTNGAKEAYLYYPSSIQGSRPQVNIAAVKTAEGYLLEAAIPWAVFGVVPSSGARYGFALSISDNDSATKNLQQSFVSSTPGRKLLNPTTWSELLLTVP